MAVKEYDDKTRQQVMEFLISTGGNIHEVERLTALGGLGPRKGKGISRSTIGKWKREAEAMAVVEPVQAILDFNDPNPDNGGAGVRDPTPVLNVPHPPLIPRIGDPYRDAIADHLNYAFSMTRALTGRAIIVDGDTRAAIAGMNCYFRGIQAVVGTQKINIMIDNRQATFLEGAKMFMASPDFQRFMVDLAEFLEGEKLTKDFVAFMEERHDGIGLLFGQSNPR